MGHNKTSAHLAAIKARIDAACSELKLSAVQRLYETICDQALRANRSPLEVIADLLEAEVEQRQQRRVNRRLKEANFPRLKTIDDFDFKRAPELPAALIGELCHGGYIDSAQGVIFLGDPGTRKSHLATALGIAACHQGRRVRFVTAANLVNDLVEAKDARALSTAVRRYTRYQLLILDDLGYLPLANHEAELVFQVLAERSERGSIVVTTNLPFSEYTKVFPDKRLCAAVLDRLTHNAHIIDTGSQSQRAPATLPRRRPKKGGEPQSNT
jgi:DNA replication protein DnaC